MPASAFGSTSRTEDTCGEPVPFLHSSLFSVRVGPHHRLITSNARQEGSVSLATTEHAVDSSSKYLYLLVDVSMSIDPEERARVLNAFIDGLPCECGINCCASIYANGFDFTCTFPHS
jgi:hypothetical protein